MPIEPPKETRVTAMAHNTRYTESGSGGNELWASKR